jgi:hypothetical protein
MKFSPGRVKFSERSPGFQETNQQTLDDFNQVFFKTENLASVISTQLLSRPTTNTGPEFRTTPHTLLVHNPHPTQPSSHITLHRNCAPTPAVASYPQSRGKRPVVLMVSACPDMLAYSPPLVSDFSSVPFAPSFGGGLPLLSACTAAFAAFSRQQFVAVPTFPDHSSPSLNPHQAMCRHSSRLCTGHVCNQPRAPCPVAGCRQPNAPS